MSMPQKAWKCDFRVSLYPAGNCMFKVNNRNNRLRCEICSNLTIKIPGKCRLGIGWYTKRSTLLRET